ncbi:hypothetical protein TNCV_3184851 [Trichonephila clavipes]|nr:hypothetical protein TNCV_3184851 [Trichonephila clavipes]
MSNKFLTFKPLINDRKKSFSPQSYRRGQEFVVPGEEAVLSQATCFKWDNGSGFKGSYIGNLPLCPTDPLYHYQDQRHHRDEASDK